MFKGIDESNTAILSQNADFNISSGHSDRSHVENKSGSEKNIDEKYKAPFDAVVDNDINQLIVLIEI